MSAKRAVWLLAVIFMASMTTFFLLRNRAGMRAKTPAGNPKTPVTAIGPRTRVVAYYFHLTVRCPRCRTIEAYSRQGVEAGFAGDLKSGALEWRSVDIQVPENERFVRDYQLFTSSLVLVKVRDGKEVEWRNLERVWDLVGNKEQFIRYVQTNVRDYL